MNTPIEMEIDYWKGISISKWEDRVSRIIKLLDIKYAYPEECVVDIGPGPWGGIFNKINAKDMWFIEPLIGHYHARNIWIPPYNKHINLIMNLAEDVVIRDKFDVVIAVNSIDHGRSTPKALDNIYYMLKDKGIFKLHLHCRTKDQLNVAHHQAFDPEDVIEKCEELFSKVKLKASDIDPLGNAKYRTVYGECIK